MLNSVRILTISNRESARKHGFRPIISIISEPIITLTGVAIDKIGVCINSTPRGHSVK